MNWKILGGIVAAVCAVFMAWYMEALSLLGFLAMLGMATWTTRRALAKYPMLGDVIVNCLMMTLCIAGIIWLSQQDPLWLLNLIEAPWKIQTLFIAFGVTGAVGGFSVIIIPKIPHAGKIMLVAQGVLSVSILWSIATVLGYKLGISVIDNVFNDPIIKHFWTGASVLWSIGIAMLIWENCQNVIPEAHIAAILIRSERCKKCVAKEGTYFFPPGIKLSLVKASEANISLGEKTFVTKDNVPVSGRFTINRVIQDAELYIDADPASVEQQIREEAVKEINDIAKEMTYQEWVVGIGKKVDRPKPGEEEKQIYKDLEELGIKFGIRIPKISVQDARVANEKLQASLIKVQTEANEREYQKAEAEHQGAMLDIYTGKGVNPNVAINTILRNDGKETAANANALIFSGEAKVDLTGVPNLKRNTIMVGSAMIPTVDANNDPKANGNNKARGGGKPPRRR